MNKLAFFLFFPIFLTAQIRSLTTNRDGSVLYFSTDAGDPQQGRVYRWKSETGIQLAFEIAREGTSNISNFYYFLSPSLSSDGNRLALTTRRDCIGGNTCALNPRLNSSVLDIRSNESLASAPAATRLSRNGKFMLRYFFAIDNTVFFDTVDSPKLIPIPAFPGRVDPGPLLSDLGQVAFADPVNGELTLWTPQSTQVIPSPPNSKPLLLTPDGKFLVYSVDSRLWSTNTSSGNQHLLFDGLTQDSNESISIVSDDDGKRLLMLVRESKDLPPQWLFAIDSNGENPTWLTFLGEGFREAIYSGDGQTIFATTTNNRLFRYNAASQIWVELSPRSAYVTEWLGTPWPGSQNQIRGGGFSWRICSAESFPWPESLCGVELSWLGKRLRIGQVTPSTIQFQIPWEVFVPPAYTPDLVFNRPAVLDQLTISTPRESRFQDSGISKLRGFTALSFDLTTLRREDGSKISSISPARPGDWLFVDLTGLGPVSATPPSGMPSPASPLSKVIEPIEIKVNDTVLSARSYEAYLAPGLVGITTLRFQVPALTTGEVAVVNVVANSDPTSTRTNQFLIPLSAVGLP